MIRDGQSGWEDLVPHEVDQIIKQNRLFGYDGPAPTDPGGCWCAMLN